MTEIIIETSDGKSVNVSDAYEVKVVDFNSFNAPPFEGAPTGKTVVVRYDENGNTESEYYEGASIATVVE